MEITAYISSCISRKIDPYDMSCGQLRDVIALFGGGCRIPNSARTVILGRYLQGIMYVRHADAVKIAETMRTLNEAEEGGELTTAVGCAPTLH